MRQTGGRQEKVRKVTFCFSYAVVQFQGSFIALKQSGYTFDMRRQRMTLLRNGRFEPSSTITFWFQKGNDLSHTPRNARIQRKQSLESYMTN